MSARIVLLGTGTCELDRGRIASSVLVESGESRFVFDMGRGVADRLSELGYLQDDVGHVVLSHYHPDHFSDLIPYLHAAAHAPRDLRTVDLHLYGPEGLNEHMERVFWLTGLWRDGKEPTFAVHLHRLEEAERIADLTVQGQSLPPAGNHGVRFDLGDCVVALTGDSAFHRRLIEFLHRSDLAIIDSGHLTDDQIVELAVRACPGRLICSHVYRWIDVDDLLARARKGGFEGRIELAEDRMDLSVAAG